MNQRSQVKYSGADQWCLLSARRRCATIGAVAGHIAGCADELVLLSGSDQRVDPVETVASELLPFCSALKFIGRRGPRILRSRRCGFWGRPLWLPGVSSRVERKPHGDVLILGTWNYPLFLPGVQAAQALAAGNRVFWKPAVGCEELTKRLVTAFLDAGVPESQLQQLDSSSNAAIDTIDKGVDLIVLTGSAATGRKVLERAAATLTPTIMELSGCDAAVVMPDADIERAAKAITFGMTMNSGATCIGPRRLIATDATADALATQLARHLEVKASFTVHPNARDEVAIGVERAIAEGAVDRFERFDAARLRDSGQMTPLLLDRVQSNSDIASADLFAPLTSIIRVKEIEVSVDIVNHCCYRLSASVFGSEVAAKEIAARLDVGSVVINDLIVPTADPRLPFGGRALSGFGVTRGAEGLLAMTVAKVTSNRRGHFLPHLKTRADDDQAILTGALKLLHGATVADRIAGLRQMIVGKR